jgi:hypothetical protein
MFDFLVWLLGPIGTVFIEGWFEILLAFLGWLLGAIATIYIAIRIERLRSPDLELAIEPLHDIQPLGPIANRWRSLKVRVSNKRPSERIDWIVRLPAQQCRGEIVFLRGDGTQFFDKPMVGRWAGTPEPQIRFLKLESGETAPFLTNPQQLRPTVDIYPGDSELLDVVVRVDGEGECYGWNDETYLRPNWRNADRMLGLGRYFVEVTITSTGRKCTGYFRIENDGPFNGFRLAPLTPNERANITVFNP